MPLIISTNKTEDVILITLWTPIPTWISLAVVAQQSNNYVYVL